MTPTLLNFVSCPLVGGLKHHHSYGTRSLPFYVIPGRPPPAQSQLGMTPNLLNFVSCLLVGGLRHHYSYGTRSTLVYVIPGGQGARPLPRVGG